MSKVLNSLRTREKKRENASLGSAFVLFERKLSILRGEKVHFPTNLLADVSHVFREEDKSKMLLMVW